MVEFLLLCVLSQVKDDGLTDEEEVPEEAEAHQHEDALGTCMFLSNSHSKTCTRVK